MMSRPAARLAVGVLLLAISTVPLGNASSGLLTRESVRAGHPMRYMVADPLFRLEQHRLSHAGEAIDHEEELSGALVPGVIIAHGFAASERLMLGYAHTLALAGYAVVLMDFAGHGRNALIFDRDALQNDIDNAYEVLVAQPEVDPERIALVGHSMGSGAVMAAARRNPERYRATVGVSPVTAEVTSSTPRNLLLQAGTWEPSYLRNAEFLLQRAGGPSDDFASGRARALVPIAAAQHLSILFRSASHRGVVQWLDGRWSSRRWNASSTATDASLVVRSRGRLAAHRHLDGAGTSTRRGPGAAARTPADAMGGGGRSACDCKPVGGPAGAADRRWGPRRHDGRRRARPVAVDRWHDGIDAGIPPRSARWARRLVGCRPVRLSVVCRRGNVRLRLAELALVSPRLVSFPIFALACIPWFTATELLQGDPGGRSRWPAYLTQTAALVAGLLVIAALVPTMRVVTAMLPVLPFYLGVLSIVGSRFNRPWGYGIGAGMFFGWLLASAFPLVG